MVDGNPVPKPPKRERGRSRGAKERSADPRWKRAERESSRWLVQCAGSDPSPPAPPSSTGRVGQYTELGYDTTSARYVGEVKNRAWPKWLYEALQQIMQCALRRGNRHPILFLEPVDGQRYFQYEGKRHRLPTIHCLTPERHAELLRYEDAVKANVSDIKKEDIITLVELVDGGK